MLRLTLQRAKRTRASSNAWPTRHHLIRGLQHAVSSTLSISWFSISWSLKVLLQCGAAKELVVNNNAKTQWAGNIIKSTKHSWSSAEQLICNHLFSHLKFVAVHCGLAWSCWKQYGGWLVSRKRVTLNIWLCLTLKKYFHVMPIRAFFERSAWKNGQRPWKIRRSACRTFTVLAHLCLMPVHPASFSRTWKDMGGGSKGKQTEGKGYKQVQDYEEVKKEVVKEKTKAKKKKV